MQNQKFFSENTPAKPDVLATELERTINDFVNRLKQQLVQTWTNPQNQRGVWDRMKGWWSNAWHGRYNQNNPYFWKNKLGDDLGNTTESVLPLTLKHYSVLNHQATLLEEALPPGSDKLQIIRVIDNWATEFKKAVFSLVGQFNQPLENIPEHPPEESPSEESPEELATTNQEPEPDTSWQQDALERLEKIKDKILSNQYDKMKQHIVDNEQEPVVSFLNYIEKHGTKTPPRTATMQNPEDVGKEQPNTTVKDPENDEWSAPPSAGNRTWHELTPHEQLAWDEWGGGNARDVTMMAKKNGIQTIPWILRIGDPRLKAIQNLRGRVLYDRMVQQKRVENPSHPIKTPEELQKAIAIASKLRDEERMVHSQRNQDTANRVKKRKTKPTVKPTEPTVEPATPTPTPTPIVTQPTKPARKPRTAKMKIEPEVTPTNIPEKKKRTAKMKLPSAPDQSTNPQKIAELHQRLEQLRDNIDSELFDHLKNFFELLGDNPTPEQISKIEKNINKAEKQMKKNKEKEEEKFYDDDDPYMGDGTDFLPIECTVTERTQSIINRFRDLTRR